MRIRDALAAIRRKKERSELIPLTTVWSEHADDKNEIPLSEYPRPQMVRDNWVCLNGWWDYAIGPAGTRYEIPDGQILVPFSPECARSGVNRVLQPQEALWYHRVVEIPRIREHFRLILHFGAVDERCTVRVNGALAGSHRGGYLPFSFDVTDHVKEGENEFLVYVRDETDAGHACRGKQKLSPGGMFYTPQSGIWQTVWMEWVPENYIRDLKIIPIAEEGTVELRIRMCHPAKGEVCVGVPGIRKVTGDQSGELSGESDDCPEADGRWRMDPAYRPDPPAGRDYDPADGPESEDPIAIREITPEDFGENGWVHCWVPVEDPEFWSPENPVLYPLEVRMGEDRADSYFAMRSFGIRTDENGNPCLTLNGEPYFHQGVLDQGYWPETLMTPPADAAMIFDIQAMKDLEFNMIRKHAKVEPLRWYYHCDRLGMLVWQDMPNGGGPIDALRCTYAPTALPLLGKVRKDIPGIVRALPLVGETLRERKYRALARDDGEERERFEQQLHAMVETLRNVPCIALWVPFNEGWGQFDAARIAESVRHQDPTRPVDHASGWFDQGAGDLRSVHNYFRGLKVEPDKHGRPFVLSEYGGLTCRIPGHLAAEDSYGYRDVTPEELPGEFDALMREVRSLRKEGLAGAVYTQVSDVEEEINGLFTYDRKVRKV